MAVSRAQLNLQDFVLAIEKQNSASHQRHFHPKSCSAISYHLLDHTCLLKQLGALYLGEKCVKDQVQAIRHTALLECLLL